MREEIGWFSGWLSPCVGYQVIIPSLVILAVIPVIIDASAGTVRRLGRDWKDVEIPVDSGRFWSIFVHLSPPGFLPTFPALRCCKVTEDFYETTRCYEDGRCCHGSRLWFSCVGRMLAASSSCHSHRPGLLDAALSQELRYISRLDGWWINDINVPKHQTYQHDQYLWDLYHPPKPRWIMMDLPCSSFQDGPYDRRVTSWSGTIWPRPNGFTWMGPSSWSMMRRITAVAPLNDDFVILPYFAMFHLKMIITITWWFLIFQIHRFGWWLWKITISIRWTLPKWSEMAEIKQGGFVGKSWDEMGHET